MDFELHISNCEKAKQGERNFRCAQNSAIYRSRLSEHPEPRFNRPIFLLSPHVVEIYICLWIFWKETICISHVYGKIRKHRQGGFRWKLLPNKCGLFAIGANTTAKCARSNGCGFLVEFFSEGCFPKLRRNYRTWTTVVRAWSWLKFQVILHVQLNNLLMHAHY